jgi:MarR family transcriptional regulator, organic hydroperoxide resistance regulator
MTAPTVDPVAAATVTPALDPRTEAIATIRSAVGELLGAERRLRARDQQRRDRMTYAQTRALIALADSGGTAADVSAGQLAKAADLHPATVTAMLDLLEEEGLVVRRRSDADRRCVLVALTPEGQALLELKRGEWSEQWDEMLADVDAEDIETAARVIRRLPAIFSGL